MAWCYTCAMPTVRLRHTTTETDEVAHLIDLALASMPANSTRSDAIRRLLQLGGASLKRESTQRTDRRNQAISRLQALTRDFAETNFREDQMAGWPE